MKLKLLSSHARVPQRATPGAAGYDLHACAAVRIPAGERRRVPLGFAVELDRINELQIRPRSGHSARGIDVALGTVDSDYRGPVSVVVINNTERPHYISAGDRIAQGVIGWVRAREGIEVVDTLSETARGAGGFGSTGVRA